MPITKSFQADCEEAIRFINLYGLDSDRIVTKYKFHELQDLAAYLGFKTKGLREAELAALIFKALKL